MAPPAPQRRVRYSAQAQQDLAGIWEWNAERYGQSRAHSYLDFLKAGIAKLASPATQGRPVPQTASRWYLLVQRKARGHGHLAVYEVVGDVVFILHVFHAAQNWQSAAREA